MPTLDNIFTSLHRWALGQEENSVSEAFAFLLQHMLRHEPELGVDLLRRLTGNSLSIPPRDAAEVSISTQVTVEQKRPDIEIRTPHWLVYVEVKVEAPLSSMQLANYRERLASSDVKNTALVLLTRYRPWIPEGQQPDAALRWFHVANWLNDYLAAGLAKSPVSRFLAEQFLDFLKEKRMSIQRIGSDLQTGARSLVGLLEMLETALDGERLPYAVNSQWRTWLGYNIEASKYYLGVYLAAAHILTFRTYSLNLDRSKAEALGAGRVWVQQGRLRWEHTADLSSNATRFYEKSTGEQMQFIEDFVHECLQLAAQITASEAVPPIELADPDEEAN